MNSMQDWYDYRRTMEQPRLASNDPSISGGPTRGIPPGGTIDIGPL